MHQLFITQSGTEATFNMAAIRSYKDVEMLNKFGHLLNIHVDLLLAALRHHSNKQLFGLCFHALVLSEADVWPAVQVLDFSVRTCYCARGACRRLFSAGLGACCLVSQH